MLNRFVCIFRAVLWRSGLDDAARHHDLSSDSLRTQPVCVLTWPALTPPSPGLSAWLFLYLAERSRHWRSPTRGRYLQTEIQKDTIACAHMDRAVGLNRGEGGSR